MSRRVTGRVQKTCVRNGIVHISEISYDGWLEDDGKLRLVGYCGKIRSVKIESVSQARRRSA